MSVGKLQLKYRSYYMYINIDIEGDI